MALQDCLSLQRHRKGLFGLLIATHASVNTNVGSVVLPNSAVEVRIPRLGQLLLPSLSDCLFVAFMLILFVSSAGWSGLLADGDTGWHLRTGEYILKHGTVPATDLFSFSKPGQPWFAWEWAADVSFALAHRYAGLKGLVFFSALVLCLAGLILFRYLIWRGAAVHIAVLVAVTVMDAAQFHFLARPHIFTLLLTPISLWIIERDIQRPRWTTWILIPIAAGWANVHGGFLVLIVSLGIFTAVLGGNAFVKRNDRDLQKRFRRFAGLTAGCLFATLANPYGIGLYLHLAAYLQSDWIINAIEEFQSPEFRSQSMFKFEILLILGLCVTPALLRRGQIASALMILAWAHQALVSARHVPIYALVSAGAIATELTALWNGWTSAASRTSAMRILDDIFAGLQRHASRTSIWIPLFLTALFMVAAPDMWPTDFPDSKFPVALLAHNAERWKSAATQQRLLSSDSWGGYLIYRFFPDRKVFIDGRSDFYGESLGKDYVCLRAACAEWSALLHRYRIDGVLIPTKWALTHALRQDPEWQLMDQDDLATWFERKQKPSPKGL